MKILHVIESLEVGGAEMLVVNLINEMPNDYNQAVCCIKKIGQLSNKIKKNVKIYCLNKNEGNSLIVPLQIAKIIRNNKFDVVHSHNWGHFPETFLGAKIGGAKVIVHTAHGAMEHYSKNIIKKKLRMFIESIVSIFIDKIIAVSDSLRSKIINDLFISKNKVVTIYNGVNFKAIDHKHKKCKSELLLVTVGRLVQVKNYKMLIRAFAIAKKRCKYNIRLIFVGDGPERNNLEIECDSYNLNNNLIFYGFCDEVDKILSESDIFVNSSHYEGISLAIIEAMKFSLPVIATSVGGNNEIISDGFSGILIPDNDVERFSDAIICLANDKKKRSIIGRNGREKAFNKFNFEKTKRNYIILYEKFLKRNLKN